MPQSPYTPEPGIYYPFHVATADPSAEKTYGYMQVNTDKEKVVFVKHSTDSEDGTISEKSLLTWELHMGANRYVLMPLIQRKGACILVDLGTEEAPQKVLACLISYPELRTMLNFETNCYQGLVNAENMVVQVRSTEALQSLVKVGTAMYLNAEVIQDERFGHASRKGMYLETRLNVPTMNIPAEGKLYVTGIYKRSRTRTRVASVSAVTFAVNPWDVVMQEHFTGEPDSIMKHLE